MTAGELLAEWRDSYAVVRFVLLPDREWRAIGLDRLVDVDPLRAWYPYGIVPPTMVHRSVTCAINVDLWDQFHDTLTADEFRAWLLYWRGRADARIMLLSDQPNESFEWIDTLAHSSAFRLNPTLDPAVIDSIKARVPRLGGSDR